MDASFTVRPPAFDAFWDEIDGELARFPAAAALEASPLRSTPFSTTYELRLTSIGPYRIFGWFSVPHGPGPFPGLVHTPGYGSVVTPAPYDDRERYAVLTLAHRGQRLADKPFAASYPGLLTHGIVDPATYIYRGIAADVLRAAEFLLGRPDVDPARVGITGNDLAIAAAARRPGFAALLVTDLLFHRLMEIRTRTEAYPIEEINDHLRLHPEHKQLVAETLEFFDPIHHAPAVAANVILKMGVAGSTSGADWLAPLSGAFAGPVTAYSMTFEGGTDRDALDALLAGHLGVEPKPRVWEIV